MSQRDPNDPPDLEVDPQPDPNQPPTAGPSADPPPQQTTPWNREQFRDEWMSTGTDLGRQNDVLRRYGISLDGAGRTTLPTGEVMDLRIGARSGQNLAGWTGVGPTAGPGGGGSGMGGSGTGGSGGGSNGFLDQVRAQLMQILQHSQQPIDPNDPNITRQMDAQNVTLEREREARRAAMAERMAANGMNSGGAGSGAFDQELASGFEDKGRQMAGLRAQLMNRATEQRMAQLQQALSLALQSGDQEAARGLQMTIAQMNADLARARMEQDQSQWNDSYGLQRLQFERLLNNDAVNAQTGQ